MHSFTASRRGRPGQLGVPAFAVTALLFGVLASVLTLTTRRWVFAWAGAFGGWFASVDGGLVIWSRQSSSGGLVTAVVAVIVLAANWFRTAWSRD